MCDYTNKMLYLYNGRIVDNKKGVKYWYTAQYAWIWTAHKEYVMDNSIYRKLHKVQSIMHLISMVIWN